MVKKTRLREVNDGTRFVLCRNGERYRRVAADLQWLPKIFVVDLSSGRETHLHFMSYVTPIVKPHLKLKLRKDSE